jgi:hypothetical protein
MEKSNCKQSARWQHISWLNASAFCIWLNKLWLIKTQQLILGTGTALWWVTEPHFVIIYNIKVAKIFGTHADIWQQKPAAELSKFLWLKVYLHYCKNCTKLVGFEEQKFFYTFLKPANLA